MSCFLGPRPALNLAPLRGQFATGFLSALWMAVRPRVLPREVDARVTLCILVRGRHYNGVAAAPDPAFACTSCGLVRSRGHGRSLGLFVLPPTPRGLPRRRLSSCSGTVAFDVGISALGCAFGFWHWPATTGHAAAPLRPGLTVGTGTRLLAEWLARAPTSLRALGT